MQTLDPDQWLLNLLPKSPTYCKRGPFLGHEPLLAATAATPGIPTAWGFIQAVDIALSHQDFKLLTVFQHLRQGPCRILSAVQVSL